jgi:hypothetical protein
MGELSEWLKIMLGEISRKQDDDVRAKLEEQRRTDFDATEPPADSAAASRPTH